MSIERLPIYEMSICARVSWQAHSLSNAGSNGSNRTMPRRQLLADGTETDACSGNIAKHHHAALVTEIFEQSGVYLCPACSARDGRRAAALVENGKSNIRIDEALLCGLCDAHGFLVTGRRAKSDGEEDRSRLSKHTLIDFAMTLALPTCFHESKQLYTRSGNGAGEGQMLMTMPSRSGQYATIVRYKSVGVGVDTDRWRVVITDEGERLRRHQAIIRGLADQLLSPTGAMTSKLLPHLSDLAGAIVIRTTAGRAPLYSPLVDNFIDELQKLQRDDCLIFSFRSVSEFNQAMEDLHDRSYPAVYGHTSGEKKAR